MSGKGCAKNSEKTNENCLLPHLTNQITPINIEIVFVVQGTSTFPSQPPVANRFAIIFFATDCSRCGYDVRVEYCLKVMAQWLVLSITSTYSCGVSSNCSAVALYWMHAAVVK
jgi:hypothetical protein